MRRFPGLLVAVVVLTTAAKSQTPANASASQPDSQSTGLHANTHPIVVDVVVQDKNGHPVHALKREDFSLTEDKAQQNLVHFEEHPALAPVRQDPPLPKLPPGTFTDYMPMPQDGTLNILLLDALNTPTKDQNFIRNQLQQYGNHANPGTRIAIFGLANRLILLQGFTSDPTTLKNIVNHKLIPRSSSLLNRRSDTAIEQQSLSNDANAPGMSQLAANLQQFEAQTGTMETQLRANFTLDAFNTLAHYLSAFPGRKNLIWFSGSFPLNLLSDPALKDPFASAQLDEQQYRETISLLTKARVAVYPVNALGIITQPVPDAATSGHSHAVKPSNLNADLKKIGTSEATEHSRMDALATDTGGIAFYNANSLAAAVANAIDAGANYYTLAYHPTNPRQDGTYREIRVNLTGAQAGHGFQLGYRRGYNPVDTSSPHSGSETATASAAAPAPAGRDAAYVAAAMSRGAPTPQNLLFKVRLLPASNVPETSVAPDNSLDPGVSPKGPFRRYDVDFVALPGELTLTLQPDGRRTGQVEFLTYVFDLYGRLLNATGKTFILTLTPANYEQFAHSAMECRMEISVPTSKETFFRAGMRDVPSNKFGVVEVPTASVSHLAPAVYQTTPAPVAPANAPATAPSTAPPPAVVPSTTPASGAAPTTPPPS